MHSRMPQEPLFGGLILVDIQVVQYDVKFAERIGPHHLIQETQEVHRRPAIPNVSDHFAGCDLQGRQQRLSAVTDVFVGPGAGLLGA